MPGPIMTANQALKEYGKQYKSIKCSGKNIRLKNSMGQSVVVGKNERVYHRGHGCFGIYTRSGDAARLSSGGTRESPVGKGNYRHTSDYKRNR